MNEAAEFRWPVRVYYEDTDAQGIVYYANYLKFMERARTEWLRALGVDQPALRAQNRLFVVTRVQNEYLVPAVFDDELVVTVQVTSRRRASFSLEQKVIGARGEHPVHCRGSVEVACLAADTLRPVRMPDKLLVES